MTTSMSTWAADILAGIGAPHTQNNVNNLSAWQACEGGDSLQRNNPFNTTLGSPQSATTVPGAVGTINSVGVETYDTYAHGLAATLQTMRQGNFSAIVSALKANAPRQTFAAAVGNSGWGTSGSCIAGSTAAAGIVAPTGAAAGGGQDAELTAAKSKPDPDCLFSVQSSKLFIFTGPTVGGCIISRAEARGMAGVALMAAGGATMALGVLILTAWGLRSAGAGRAAGSMLEAAGAGAALVPGLEGAGLTANRAGTSVRERGAGGAAADASLRRARRRQAAAAPPAPPARRRRAPAAAPAGRKPAPKGTPKPAPKGGPKPAQKGGPKPPPNNRRPPRNSGP